MPPRLPGGPRRAAIAALALLAAACSTPDSPGPPDGGQPDGGSTTHPTPGPGQAAAWKITDKKDLIPGPSTGGRVGDWMLANGKVRFIVEGVRTSDGYDPFGGSIVAADRQRASGGESRWGEVWMALNFRTAGADEVTLLSDGSNGEDAAIRVAGPDRESPFMASLFDQTLTPPPLQATFFREYVLGPDDEALRMNITIRNNGADPLTLRAPYVGMAMNRGLWHWVPESGYDFSVLTNVNRAAEFYAAVGDAISYSVINLDAPLSPILNFAKVLIGQYPQVTIQPGQARAFRFAVAVGTGDTSSLQAAHARLRGALSDAVALDGTVKGPQGEAVARARVHVARTADKTKVVAMARAGDDGAWSASLPPGAYTLYAVADDRPFTVSKDVVLEATGLHGQALTLGAASRLDVTAKEGSAALPVKIVAEPTAANPRTAFPAAFGEKWQRQPVVVFSATGAASIPVFPGSWKVTVSRGFEYDVSVQTVTAPAGGAAAVDAVLARVVDTTGWMSGDFHVHAQFSPDADDLLDLKVKAFAGEGVEIPVSTEHEFIGDFGPTVTQLALGAFMHPITGTELTTTAIGHFNVFPLVQLPAQPNMGAFDWYDQAIPTVLAGARTRLAPGGLVPAVQLNHPRSAGMSYLDAVGFQPASFTAGQNAQHFTTDFDAMEVWNGEPLARFHGCPHQELGCVAPVHPVIYDWFGWLVRGRRIAATGNSDSHSASFGAVGYPRTYLQLGSDAPGPLTDAQVLGTLRQQKAVISGGPFLMITAPGPNGTTVTPGGVAPGEGTPGSGSVRVTVTVQAPVWMGPMARLDLWHGDLTTANKPGKILLSVDLSQGPDKDPGTQVLRHSKTYTLPIAQDDFIVATVRGPMDDTGSSSALWPVIQSGLPPFAITNPIWVDANRDGAITPMVP